MTSRSRGFTLVEIMVVVVIVGLLTLLAVPAFNVVRKNSQSTRLINDYRQIKSAIEVYVLENGEWPADLAPGEFPPELEGYISAELFEGDYMIDGNWDWDGYDVHDPFAGVTFIPPGDRDEIMVRVDESLDDGDLSTGIFQKSLITAGGYTYLLEQ